MVASWQVRARRRTFALREGRRCLVSRPINQAMRVFRWVIFVLVWSAALAGADPPPTYYSAATGLTGGPLKQALHGIISNHTVISYGSLVSPLIDVWRDPANSGNILLTYSHTSVAAGSNWNREHLWPRSRGNSDQSGPDDSDLFHVVPTDVSVNAERGSLYFDESDPGDPAYALPAHALAPQTSRDSDSWQPPPQERGDIARALFYMDVRYDGQEGQTTDLELVSFPPTASQMGRLNTLLLWHAEDPPDAAERARNDKIYASYQHNRNPFIDHPEWVEAIWGVGTPGGTGSRPIARVSAVAASAVEAPSTNATFLVALNQFAGVGGLTVAFTMTGTAGLAEYALSGAGVTYDAATGAGSVLIPANFSSALVTLTPVSDSTTEGAETAVATLAPGNAYTVVPDASATATLTITDAPSLPASWSFDAPPYANPLAANSGVGSISFSGWNGTVTSFTGQVGSALALVGSAGNGSWIDIQISMAGYTNLALSFYTRGTTSGFSSGTWSASTDGVNFTTLSGVNTATQNTTFVQRNVSFASIPGLTNAPNVTLRYTLSGASGSSANNRIDELSITASPIVSGDTQRTVSIAAADGSANEATLDPGTFAVQLNGLAPAGGLEVQLFFGSGTATAPGLAGADYTLTGLASYDSATRIGRVFFPAGQSTAVVTVTPVADAAAESTETVIASVVSSASYLVGANSSAIVTILVPVVNDAFSAASILTGSAATASGTNIGATRETGEPWHHVSLQTGGRSVWWKWTAPANGALGLSTAGSNFDTMLAIYQGSAVGGLTRLGVNDDANGLLTSSLAVRVSAGFTYTVAVDGYGQSAGQIALALTFTPVPIVTLSVVNAVAKERGAVPAVVRFTLSQATPLPLPLALSIGGSALASTDYTLSSGSTTSLTIPANTLSVDLTFLPSADADLTEGAETISVLLANGIDYQPQPFPQNSVALSLEDDSPYSAAWLAAHPGLSAAAAEPFGDADADGLPGLLEYVGDRDPRLPDGAALLTVAPQIFLDPADGLAKTFAALRFVRRIDAAAIPLVVETRESLDTGTWQPGGIFISATPVAGTACEELLYRSAAPLLGPGAAAAGYFRLRATAP